MCISPEQLSAWLVHTTAQSPVPVPPRTPNPSPRIPHTILTLLLTPSPLYHCPFPRPAPLSFLLPNSALNPYRPFLPYLNTSMVIFLHPKPVQQTLCPVPLTHVKNNHIQYIKHLLTLHIPSYANKTASYTPHTHTYTHSSNTCVPLFPKFTRATYKFMGLSIQPTHPHTTTSTSTPTITCTPTHCTHYP